MDRSTFSFALLGWLVLPALAFAGPIVQPAGLPAGTQYRVVFASSTSGPAMSSNIADYNTFITNTANSDAVLASLGTTWTAIVSTTSVAARDNTGTNPMTMGVPIYNLAGELIATSNADLWDGTIATHIYYDQHGEEPRPGFEEVWTGTGWNGMSPTANDPLGTAAPGWGESNLSSSHWIHSSQGSYNSDGIHTFYGISGVLTAIPEPGTIILGLLGGISLFVMRRRLRR